MIHWCAFCQTFQGETPPFERKDVSHGLCVSCAKTGIDWSDEQEARVRGLADLNRRFWAAGLVGDPDAMIALAEEAVREGIRPIDLLFGLAGPLLVKVGDLWESGELTVAEEHRFTFACEAVIRLVSRHVKTPVASGGSVLLSTIEGNEHTLGLRFAQLGLASIGIASTWVTQELPPRGIVELALSGGHSVVGLSISMADQVSSLQRTLEAFGSETSFKGRILVGGAGVTEELASRFPAENTRFLVRPRFREDEKVLYLGS